MGGRPPSVVSLGAYLPYDGIDHAGGRYVQILHRTLLEDADVTFVVPDEPRNREALGKPGVPGDAVLLGVDRPRVIRSALWRVRKVAPTLPDMGFTVRLVTSREVRRRIRGADVIDIQWAEYAWLAGFLRRINPDARIVCTLHDVLSQKHDRLAALAAGRRERFLHRTAARTARGTQRRALRLVDRIVVFSKKDAELLAGGSEGSVSVIPPPLSRADQPERAVWPDEPEVLFVGAMSRPENHDAACWLLDEIWPAVHRAVPSARLTIAGSAPREDLIRLAKARPAVEVTGRVASLDPYYARASALVVPLRRGAGVKFKTIDAMLWGIPVVATDIGVEGIGDPTMFAGVHNAADEIADTLVRVLLEPAPEADRAREARRWAMQEFDSERTLRDLSVLYLDGGQRGHAGGENT